MNLQKKSFLIIGGVVTSFLLLEAALHIVGFSHSLLRKQSTNSIDFSKDETRILCIGDSVTALGGHNSWPSQLQTLISKNHPDKKVLVINGAIPGSNTEIIKNKLTSQIQQYKPSIVISMLGITDDWHIINDEIISPFSFSTFLKKVKTFKFLQIAFTWLKQNPNGSNAINAMVSTPKDKDEKDDPSEVHHNIQKKKHSFKIPKYEQYYNKGVALYKKKNFLEADKYFSQLSNASAMDLPPDAFLSIGYNYLQLGNPALAEASFDKYLINDGAQLLPLVQTLLLLSASQNYQQLRFPKKYINKLKDRYHRNYNLAFLYYHHASLNKQLANRREYYQLAEDLFKQNITKFQNSPSRHSTCLNELFLYYIFSETNRDDEATQILKEGYVKCPNDFHLGYNFASRMASIDPPYGEKILNEMLKKFPNHPMLSKVYLTNCNNFRNKCNSKKQHETISGSNEEGTENLGLFTNPKSKANYIHIVKEAQNENIKVIIAQYPRRDIKVLEQLFSKLRSKIILIDNREPFNSLLENKKMQYDSLFTDRFAGDFGHTSTKGSHFIAKNIYSRIKSIL